MDESISAASGRHPAAVPLQAKTATHQGGGKLFPVTDCISVDTSQQFIDIPHQDSGSNQSGSDSGLGGYTNSISSDNSSSNNAIALTASASAAVQDQAKNNANHDSSVSIINGNNNKFNHQTTGTSKNLGSKIVNKPLIGVKPTIEACLPNSQGLLLANGAIFNNESKINTNCETSTAPDNDGSRLVSDKCTKLTSSPNAQSTLFKSSIHEHKQSPTEHQLSHQQQQKGNTKSCDLQVHQAPVSKHSEHVHASSSVSPPSIRDDGGPILKSLLKKPSKLHGDDTPLVKHKKSVSFNQTVIVFCEEIRTYPPDDQYELPTDYQDPSCGGIGYEPPNEYCDHKTNTDEGIENSTNHRDEIDGAAFHDKSLGRVRAGFDVAANLTDDQLIGLLENESLLNVFKLDSDDLSEEDFPINHMIDHSNNSYLCNDAISDYDSDSESSLFIETRAQHNKITSSSDRRANTFSSNSAKPSKIDEKFDQAACGEAVMKGSDNISDSKGSLAKTASINRSTAQKSMSARMKVSTLDSSQMKKQLEKLEANDLRKIQAFNQRQISEKKAPHDISVKSQLAAEAMAIANLAQPANNNSILPSQAPKQGLGTSSSSNTSELSQREVKATHLAKPTEQITKLVEECQRSSQQASNSSHQTSSCQMCRFAELNKMAPSWSQHPESQKLEHSVHEHHSNVINKQIINHVDSLSSSLAPQAKSTNANVMVSQGSCVSCIEANSTAPNNRIYGLVRPDQQPQPTQQQFRPLAYQIVYVVDAHGNRVRALSLVRPPQGYSGANPIIGRQLVNGRFIINNQGLRFPNPVTLANGQNTSIGNNSDNQGVSMNQNSQANQTMAKAADLQQKQYRMLAAGQLRQSAQSTSSDVPNPQRPTNLANYANNYVGLCSNLTNVQRLVPVDGLRHHTVYYLRQPLDSHDTSCQANSLTVGQIQPRSFPDPHEVRRLDGLMAPVVSMDKLNQHRSQDSRLTSRQNENSVPKSFAMSQQVGRDDNMDDPTFGFSKRPSVKVVSSAQNHHHKISPIAPSQLDTSQLHPVSLIKSQTLDRRQQTNNQQSIFRENIPSSNSMLNIPSSNYTTDVNPNDSRSNNSMNPSQQPRISEQKSSTLSKTNKDSSHSNLKGTSSNNNFKRWLSKRIPGLKDQVTSQQ